MTRTIVIACDAGDDMAPRLRLAHDLADRFKARVIGVAAQSFMAPLASNEIDMGMIDALRQAADDAIRDAERRFREVVTEARDADFRSGYEDPTQFLARHARVADFVVVGPHVGGELIPSLAVQTGEAVMRLGRPLLVAPSGCNRLSAKRILVAWRDTREARRALWDAMPFIEQADDVWVASLGDERDEAGARDVTDMIAGRGVHATPIIRAKTDAALADTLFQLASDRNVDLIVAGAYGHNRLREWALGGVTRDLIQRSPVCCLISH